MSRTRIALYVFASTMLWLMSFLLTGSAVYFHYVIDSPKDPFFLGFGAYITAIAATCVTFAAADELR